MRLQFAARTLVVAALTSASVLVVGPAPPPVAAAAHDQSVELRNGLASFVSALGGLGVQDPLADDVPFTTADLAGFLDLDARLGALASAVLALTPTSLDDLDGSIELPGGGATLDISVDQGTSPYLVTLDLELDETGAADVAALAGPLAIVDPVPNGSELTASLSVSATLEFDPDELDGPDPLSALRVRTSGPDAAAAELTAAFGVEWTDLAAQVGILAVEVSGEVAVTTSATLAFASDPLDGAVTRNTWQATPGLDLFTPVAQAASVDAALEVTSDVAGTGTGTVTVSWDSGSGPADWRDAVQAQLGAIGDFDHIVIEEVFLVLAQLTTTLRAIQISGAADAELAFLAERLRSFALHQRLVGWFDALGLASTSDEGTIVLLDILDREVLAGLGLLDLQSVLASLGDELDETPVASYDALTQQLSFDLDYTDSSEDVAVGLAFGDRLEGGGLRALAPTASASALADPSAQVQLGVSVSLVEDPERLEPDPDPEVLLSVLDRTSLRTADSAISLDVPVEVDLSLTGNLGYLGVAVTGTGTLLDRADPDVPMLTVTFTGGPLLSLGALVNGLTGATPSVAAQVGIQVPPLELSVSAAPAIDGLTAGTAVISWEDITDPDGLQVDVSGLGDIGAFDTDDPFALLGALLQALDNGLDELDDRLRGAGVPLVPLAGANVNQLLGELAAVRDQVHELATDPAATVQGLMSQLAAKIDAALGVSGASVELSVDSHDGPLALVASLEVAAARSLTSPVQLSLGVIELAGGSIGVGYEAGLALHAGVELGSLDGSPQLFLRRDSGARLELSIDNDNLSVEVNAGPLKVGVIGGEVQLDAELALTDGGSGRVSLDDASGWLSSPELTVSGSASATLPLYLGDDALGDVTLTADPIDTLPWDITVPQGLLDAIAANILDFSIIVDGMRYVVQLLDRSFTTSSHGIKVPFVGDALDGGASLAAMLDDLLDRIESTFAGLSGDVEDIEAQILNGLQQAILNATGLEIELDDIGLTITCAGGCGSNPDIAFVDGIEVSLQLGDTKDFSVPTFDLGLPGFRLGLVGDSALTTEVEWELDLTFGLDRATGFYLSTAAAPEARAATSLTLADQLDAHLAFVLMQLVKNHPDPDHAELELSATADLTSTGGKLTLQQLLSGNDRASVNLGIDATADFRYRLQTVPSIPDVIDLPVDDGVLPALSANLTLAWAISGSTGSGFNIGTPDISFGDVGVYAGSVVNGFLQPILSEVQKFTKTFKPVLDVASAPVPVLSDIYELLGQGPLTMLTLFEAASGADLTMIRRILGLVQLASALADAVAADDVITLGAFDVDGATALDRQLPPTQASQLVQNAPTPGSIFGAPALSGASSAVHRARTEGGGGGFSFGAFDNPVELFHLLVGADVTLIEWRSGRLEAGIGHSIDLPPLMVGPVPVIISITMSASIAGQFGVGYDTYGIRRAVEQRLDSGDAGNFTDELALLFHGVYLTDWDERGVDVPEIVLSARFGVGGRAELGLAAAGIEGGLEANLNLDLRDNTNTGKVRLDQIVANKGYFTPICLFIASGQLAIYVDAFLRLGIGPFSKTFNWNLVRITLLNLNDIFAATCADVEPRLATVVKGDNGAVLALNTGPRKNQRNIVPAEDDEKYVVRPLNLELTSFSVSAFGEYEEFHGVTGVEYAGRLVKVVGDGGPGKDMFKMADGSLPSVPDNANIDDPDAPIDNVPIPFEASVLLCGGADDDVLYGGRGDPTRGLIGDILVGDGSCTVGVSGGNVNLSFSVAEQDEDGQDTIHAIGGRNEIYGTGGDDQLHGSPDGGDLIVGGGGDDVLRASPEATTGSILIGGQRSQAETLDKAAPGFDQLFGGAGPDILIADNGDVLPDGSVVVGLFWSGDGTAMSGRNLLEGGPGNDRLFGGPGVDEMYGGPGNDYLDGGPGNDYLVGGVADSATTPRSVLDPGSNVLVGGGAHDHLAAHHAEVRPGTPGEILPAGSHTNPALLLGGALYPQVTLPGDDVAWGGAGPDLIIGDNAEPMDDDLRVTVLDAQISARYPAALNASAFAGLRAVDANGIPTGLTLLSDHGGDDRLYGGPGNDSVFGGSGDDILLGGWPRSGVATGSNLLVGGRGHDVLVGGNARVPQRAGPNSPDDGTPVVTLLGAPTPPSPTVNRLIGGSWDDLSDPGNDWLYAGRFGDVMIGDNGRIDANLTADVFLTHGGDDHIFGSVGPDRGFGGPGDDVMRGGVGNDILEGGPGDDELHGDSGNDILIGGSSRPGVPSGDDRLFGGFGVDALAGDNARIVMLPGTTGLHGTPYAVQLYDLPAAGATAPAGTIGNDVLSGGPGTDLLYGQNGVDWLFGDEGNDFLQGGPGDDFLFGGSGADSLVGGSGLHSVITAPGPWPQDAAVMPGHRVPAPNPAAVAWQEEELEGTADGNDLLVGGTGNDAMAGDNARIERVAGQWVVTLFDVEYAGETAPHPGTAGDDVLIGGSLGNVGLPGNDLGFGQGGNDLLIGDNAQPVIDGRLWNPLLHASDGNDHLEGGPGDDTLFGTGGDDVLIGGSSNRGIADAHERGVVSGNDLLVGGPGDDYGLGDNGSVDLPAPWWATGEGGASVTLYDELIDGEPLPHPATAGRDLLIGGSLRGSGLLGEQAAGSFPGHDLFHGQGDDDLLFGDDVVVDTTRVGDWVDGWHAIRPDVTQPISTWPIATLDWITEPTLAAAGGDDLLLGGSGDDIVFGGPGQDDIIGGSWNLGRHDGRDLIDGGPGHDVIAGDNATILRPYDEGTDTFLCQTYRHRHGDVDAWLAAGGSGTPFDCAVGTPDAAPDDGVLTRVVRKAMMLDTEPGITSGSDLVWGGHGDDDITGQFDDTADVANGSWSGLPAWRAIEWCRLDDHLAALMAADALDVAVLADGATMADYLAFYGFALDDVVLAGDVLCGGPGEDAILGDQGLVDNIVEDGSREAVIAPQQPFMDALIYAQGTLTRVVTLTQIPVGGDDVILGGGDGDWLHGGAGDDLVNGNGGDDRIFGGDGNDALWGGAGDDHLYGGYHDDHLDVRPRLTLPATGPGSKKKPPVHPGDPAVRFLVAVEGDTYDGIDHLYGGWHRDIMQADEGDNGPVPGDRLMDWGGVYNLWYNCPATYGAWIDIRSPYPGLREFLTQQAAGDGARDPHLPGSSGFNELAMVFQQDIRHNTNPPHPETPGHFTCGAADGT